MHKIESTRENNINQMEQITLVQRSTILISQAVERIMRDCVRTDFIDKVRVHRHVAVVHDEWVALRHIFQMIPILAQTVDMTRNKTKIGIAIHNVEQVLEDLRRAESYLEELDGANH